MPASDPLLNDLLKPEAALSEVVRPIQRPRHDALQNLLTLWQQRPADGFVIGRDIPSRAFAPLLSHILVWQPQDDCRDLTLHLCGEALRLRFGDDAVGKRFSELVAPEVTPYFVAIGAKMLHQDFCACFDMHLTRKQPIEGRATLHFELMIFPLWSPHRQARWILNALAYFL